MGMIPLINHENSEVVIIYLDGGYPKLAGWFISEKIFENNMDDY
jgi:hypothetical protein